MAAANANTERPLANQTALVTGASTGLGYSIARMLGEQGARVLVNGSNAARVAAAVETLSHAVPGATFVAAAADVSTAAGCEALAREHPDVDVLVNNAGVYETRDFFEATDDDWRRAFDVNLMSGVRLCRAYLKGMLGRNRGRIVFVASESGVQVPVDMIHYGASKAAQIAAARGVAECTQGTRVTVNSVLPGPARSAGVERMLEKLSGERNVPLERMEEEFFRRDRPTSIIKRFIEPEEVASAVCFLCSEGAGAINGTALRVDGGLIRFAF
eukprot:m51a1_g11117 putative oxidoreductase (272) ;mRNA; f:106201-107402